MVCSNGKNSTFTIQPHGLSENTPNDCSTLEKTILKSLGTLMRSSPSLLLLSLPSLLEWSSLFANPSDRLNATFANKVEDTSGGDQTTYFQDELEFWKNAIRSFFKNEIISDPGSLQSPPVCPTGYYRQHRSLPICEDWLTKFWETCYNVIRSKGSFTLVKDKNSLPSWRIIKKRLLIMSVIGLGVTVVYIILNWLHPKKLSK